MISVKKLSYNEIQKTIGKNAHFISDCEFFPNFNVYCKIIDINISTNREILFTVKTKEGRKIIIGSNMKNLQLELI